MLLQPKGFLHGSQIIRCLLPYFESDTFHTGATQRRTFESSRPSQALVTQFPTLGELCVTTLVALFSTLDKLEPG